LAQLYNFPTGLTGEGECIAIIELGGGYRAADLNTYFAQLGIPKPSISSVSVDGGHNHPTGNPGGPDGEVMLDIEVAGAVAPGARIAVYFAPNTTRGFLDAITTAIHDSQRKPSVISISWGSAEKNWSRNALQSFDQAFQEAALLGVTVCCASGDNGSSDGENDSLAHVDFPASSPSALGCGGTRLEVSNGAISREVVWNEGATGGATGGGVSDFFPLPSYQAGANVPVSVNPGGSSGRGVPDVAGDADPNTGYQILVDGKRGVFGGTSAVAPLWAGLIALINQKLGKPVGFLNSLLYGQLATAGVVRDITSGGNDISQLGGYDSSSGWDACSGLGTPDGAKLLSALAGEAEVTSVAATAKPTK
jgi:kumamolisin